jgi:hypothetical protein
MILSLHSYGRIFSFETSSTSRGSSRNKRAILYTNFIVHSAPTAWDPFGSVLHSSTVSRKQTWAKRRQESNKICRRWRRQKRPSSFETIPTLDLLKSSQSTSSLMEQYCASNGGHPPAAAATAVRRRRGGRGGSTHPGNSFPIYSYPWVIPTRSPLRTYRTNSTTVYKDCVVIYVVFGVPQPC